MADDLNRRRLFGVALLALAVGAAAWWTWQESGATFNHPSSRAEAGSGEQRLAALEQRLEANDAILAQMAATLDRLEARGGAPSASAQRTFREQDASVAAISRDRALAGYEQEFRTQSHGSAWGQKTADLLTSRTYSEDLMAITSAMPLARDVSCRATMCRMVFTFPDAAEATEWAEAYQVTLGTSVGRIWSSAVTDPDGNTRVAMYGFK